MKTKGGVVRAASSAGVELEAEDMSDEPGLRWRPVRGPSREVVRYVIEKTPGAETCRIVARLECGHRRRVNAYGTWDRLHCDQCPDE